MKHNCSRHKQDDFFKPDLTYLCSDSSCINACSASTAKENDINTRNSCLNRHLQEQDNMLALIIVTNAKFNSFYHTDYMSQMGMQLYLTIWQFGLFNASKICCFLALNYINLMICLHSLLTHGDMELALTNGQNKGRSTYCPTGHQGFMQ